MRVTVPRPVTARKSSVPWASQSIGEVVSPRNVRVNVPPVAMQDTACLSLTWFFHLCVGGQQHSQRRGGAGEQNKEEQARRVPKVSRVSVVNWAVRVSGVCTASPADQERPDHQANRDRPAWLVLLVFAELRWV